MRADATPGTRRLLVAAAGVCLLPLLLRGQPAVEGLRDQVRSIAAEIGAHDRLRTVDTVLLRVTGSALPQATENALIAALTAAGKTVFLDSLNRAYPELLVSILLQESNPLELGPRTLLEARLTAPNGGAAEVLGSYVRPEEEGDGLDGWWDRLGAPAVVIAAGLLIVYLLFTVRS